MSESKIKPALAPNRHTRPVLDPLQTIEIKAFIPAKDFTKSRQFYRAIGFEEKSQDAGISYFCKGSCSFLLQDFSKPELDENFMMHLLVADASAWHTHLNALDLTGFNCRLSPLIEQPWAMLDFTFNDPSGVLWRIGQNIER